MTREQFNQVVENRIHLIKQSLGTKAGEYASDQSAFHNFQCAARVLGTTPTKALVGMYVKHHVSVMDFVEGNKEPQPHLVAEKIGDMINYLILLEAMLYEEYDRYQELPF